jgi:hypothetical protein
MHPPERFITVYCIALYHANLYLGTCCYRALFR